MAGTITLRAACPLGSTSPDRRTCGEKAGVRAWSQTTGVWLRGILDEYGVDHRDITWVTEEDAHVQNTPTHPNVRRIARGQDLKAMLLAKQIDAAVALVGLDPSAVRPVSPIRWPPPHGLSGPGPTPSITCDACGRSWRNPPMASAGTDAAVHRRPRRRRRTKRRSEVQRDRRPETLPMACRPTGPASKCACAMPRDSN